MALPSDPNDELQRDQLAVNPKGVPEPETDEPVSLESQLETVLDNPATIKAVAEFLRQEGYDAFASLSEFSDVKITPGFWGWREGSDIATIESGNREFFVAPDYDTCVRMATALVKNDLQENPENFEPSFIESYINTERLRDDLMSDVQESIRENLEIPEPEEVEEGEEAPEPFDVDAEVERLAEEELRDPIQYMVGIFGREDGIKQAISLAGLDYEEAAEAAVAADGPGHFLSSYDGNIHELPGDGYFWRHN